MGTERERDLEQVYGGGRHDALGPQPPVVLYGLGLLDPLHARGHTIRTSDQTHAR